MYALVYRVQSCLSRCYRGTAHMLKIYGWSVETAGYMYQVKFYERKKKPDMLALEIESLKSLL